MIIWGYSYIPWSNTLYKPVAGCHPDPSEETGREKERDGKRQRHRVTETE